MPMRALQAAQLHLHLVAQLLVERRERLVQQDDLGLHHQRAGQRDALPLAAGQFMRLALAVAFHVHQRQHLVDFAGDLLPSASCGS